MAIESLAPEDYEGEGLTKNGVPNGCKYTALGSSRGMPELIQSYIKAGCRAFLKVTYSDDQAVWGARKPWKETANIYFDNKGQLKHEMSSSFSKLKIFMRPKMTNPNDSVIHGIDSYEHTFEGIDYIIGPGYLKGDTFTITRADTIKWLKNYSDNVCLFHTDKISAPDYTHNPHLMFVTQSFYDEHPDSKGNNQHFGYSVPEEEQYPLAAVCPLQFLQAHQYNTKTSTPWIVNTISHELGHAICHLAHDPLVSYDPDIMNYPEWYGGEISSGLAFTFNKSHIKEMRKGAKENVSLNWYYDPVAYQTDYKKWKGYFERRSQP